ncbi:MAG: carboxylesterase, partial [Hyphomicrobiales bacterium]|nr:carboxylesterase [Hyphomicrobiales bacterium]
MNPSYLTAAFFAMLALWSAGAQAAPDDRAIPVTPDNFVRAESDLYFS